MKISKSRPCRKSQGNLGIPLTIIPYPLSLCYSIEDKYVVKVGDQIEFRTIPMPPRMVQRMAVEAHLIDIDSNDNHERWDSKPDLMAIDS